MLIFYLMPTFSPYDIIMVNGPLQTYVPYPFRWEEAFWSTDSFCHQILASGWQSIRRDPEPEPQQSLD